MTDYVYITEYNNYGDTNPGMIREPALAVQKVKIGDVSADLHKDTRVVALFSTAPCKVHFMHDTEEPNEDFATPMHDHYEITRIIHMATGMAVATFRMD